MGGYIRVRLRLSRPQVASPPRRWICARSAPNLRREKPLKLPAIFAIIDACLPAPGATPGRRPSAVGRLLNAFELITIPCMHGRGTLLTLAVPRRLTPSHAVPRRLTLARERRLTPSHAVPRPIAATVDVSMPSDALIHPLTADGCRRVPTGADSSPGVDWPQNRPGGPYTQTAVTDLNAKKPDY